MNFTREEFEAVVATIPDESLKESSWVKRVNSWEKVREAGALQAAYLRRWSRYVELRAEAPEFFDWLLAVFPASEDQRLLEERAAVMRTLFDE